MSDELEKAETEKARFLSKYGITEEQFAATGLQWSVLVEIRQRHTAMEPELQPIGLYVSERLRMVPEIHSLRRRIKDGEHLVEKIIRKKREEPSLEFNTSSYESLVTDLIGVRAIHLFKDQWQAIHQVVKDTWNLQGDPVAYVRKGDPPQLQDSFREAGCEVKEHDYGYRSVHYLIKFPAKCTRLVELQVRTIFEEGWSEIDHLVRYPQKSSDTNLEVFLQIFNRLAGSADEMGTFTKTLDIFIRDHARKTREKECELNVVISKLKLTHAEKASLEKKVAELQTLRPLVLGAPNLDINVSGSMVVDVPAYAAAAMAAMSPGVLIAGLKVCTACGAAFVDTTGMGERCPQCRS